MASFFKRAANYFGVGTEACTKLCKVFLIFSYIFSMLYLLHRIILLFSFFLHLTGTPSVYRPRNRITRMGRCHRDQALELSEKARFFFFDHVPVFFFSKLVRTTLICFTLSSSPLSRSFSGLTFVFIFVLPLFSPVVVEAPRVPLITMASTRPSGEPTGFVQGLDWFSDQLREDAEGDVAQAFFRCDKPNSQSPSAVSVKSTKSRPGGPAGAPARRVGAAAGAGPAACLAGASGGAGGAGVEEECSAAKPRVWRRVTGGWPEEVAAGRPAGVPQAAPGG